MLQLSIFETMLNEFNSFLSLVQHRFASHCCETLFIQAAPVITYELTALGNEFEQADSAANDQVSMEYLYLSAVRELEGSLGYLMMDKFASHTLRVLLLVLAGRPLSNTATLAVLQGKTKDIGNAGTQISALPPELFEMRSVPGSFGTVLDDFMSGTTAGLDTTYLQALAMHPTGNPVLQLLLELEFTRAEKSRAQDANSLIRRLIPDDPPVDGTQSSSFINGLLYDPVGSRLLETIVQHAPGKLFKSLYRHLFREHLGKFAKNEVAGFIVVKLLERLSRADLENAIEQLLPLLPLFLERSRTSVIKAMIERCRVRQVAMGDVAQALQAVFHISEPSGLFNVLKLDAAHTEGMSNDRKSWVERQTNERAHASILVQTMTASPGPLRDIVIDDILKMNSPSLLAMAKDRTTTHIIQQLLICADQTKPFRKKFTQLYYGHLAEMALDPIASHVVDTFWTATHDLLFVREAVAEELLKNEPTLRESISGRAVWKNWRMDLYKRRRVEWIAEAKGLSRAKAVKDTARASYSVVSSGSTKSAIQLARERFAATKVQVGVHTISDLGNTT
jgi:nucleolar protein 9